jgi:hypothetical protein
MPAIGFRIARASAFAFLLFYANLTAAGIEGSHVPQDAAASNTHIAAPDQPGPFNVGVGVAATESGADDASSGVLSDCGTRPTGLRRRPSAGSARCVTDPISSPGSRTSIRLCPDAGLPGLFQWSF